MLECSPKSGIYLQTSHKGRFQLYSKTLDWDVDVRKWKNTQDLKLWEYKILEYRLRRIRLIGIYAVSNIVKKRQLQMHRLLLPWLLGWQQQKYDWHFLMQYYPSNQGKYNSVIVADKKTEILNSSIFKIMKWYEIEMSWKFWAL